MNVKQSITRTVIIFTALSVAGISMAASAQFVSVAFAQNAMVTIGSAIFGAGLAFFLVRISMLTEK